MPDGFISVAEEPNTSKQKGRQLTPCKFQIRIKTMNYLDIDYLKSLPNKPYWFGLGFIQLKIDDNKRLHFWHPDLSPNVDDEEIHDHRYDFRSMILKGEITNKLFGIEEDNCGDYEMCWVYCDKEHSGKPEHIADVEIISCETATYMAGQSYTMKMDDFHRSIFKVPTVTFLERGPVTKDRARIVKLILRPAVCPFSIKKSEDEIWSYIKEILR